MRSLFKLQLLLFLVLLLSWNIFIPILEGADEVGHFCHADYIAHRSKIPNLNEKDGCFLVYQPLYYILLAPIIKAFNFSEFNYRGVIPNPQGNLLKEGEYAQFVHNKNELFFKWNSFQIMIHLLRLVSSIYAIAIFYLAWVVSAKVFTKQIHRNLSLLLFFNPMFLHIFTTLTNVVLVTLLASLFIAYEIYYPQKKKPQIVTFLQGILFGLGLITKISIFGLAFAYLYLFLKRWKEEPFVSKVKETLVFMIGVLFTSGWYMYRSYNLYGEPLEINVARSYAGEWHWTLLSRLGFLNFWNSFADTVFRTFWSGYGALTINFPQILNVILLIITLLIAYGIISQRDKLNPQLKVCLYYFVSIFFFLVIVNIRTSSMHAKDLFTSYIPLVFLSSFGLSEFSSLIKKRSINVISQIIILALSIYFFTRYEIVRLTKLAYQFLGFEGFYQKENVDLISNLLHLIIKIILVFVIYFLILALLKKAKINYRMLHTSTIFLLIFNLITLAVTTYLFYFKFI